MSFKTFQLTPPLEQAAEMCIVDETRFVLCDLSGQLKLINVRTGQTEEQTSIRGTVPYHWLRLRSLRVVPERSLCVAAGRESYSVYLWNYRANTLRSITPQTSHAESARVSRCGTKLYIGTGAYVLDPADYQRAFVECWDISGEPKCEWTYRLPGTCVDRIAVNFDDTEITCVSGLRCQTRSIAARIRVENGLPDPVDYIEVPFTRCDGALYAPSPHDDLGYVAVSGGGYLVMLGDSRAVKWVRQLFDNTNQLTTFNTLVTWNAYDVLFSLSGDLIDFRTGTTVAKVEIPANTFTAQPYGYGLIVVSDTSEVSYQKLPDDVLVTLARRMEETMFC